MEYFPIRSNSPGSKHTSHRYPPPKDLCQHSGLGGGNLPLTTIIMTTVIGWNTRSLTNKASPIISFIKSHKAKIICLVETWHNQNDTLAAFKPLSNSFSLISTN